MGDDDFHIAEFDRTVALEQAVALTTGLTRPRDETVGLADVQNVIDVAEEFLAWLRMQD